MSRSPRWIALIGLLTIGYAAQLVSPLRTNTDATCYLEMGASASDGHGFVCCPSAVHYPIGYPALLSLLDRSGVACSATIIGLNLLGLVAGLVASAFLLRKAFGWTTPTIQVAIAASLLNWTVIKHATLPITDSLYFGLSLVCLAVLTDVSEREYPAKLPGLAIGLILIGLAIAVRTVGITLIPAFAFASISTSEWAKGIDTVKKNKAVAVSLVLTAGLVGLTGLALIVRTNYFLEMWQFQLRPIELAMLRLDDWGELALNLSMAKVPSWLRGLQLIAGASVAILLIAGFARRRRIQVIDITMAGYMAILCAWPFRDARFWIPVLPLMLGYVVTSVRPLLDSRRLRWVAPTYLTAYSLLGLMALGYSSWLSFSGDRFGDRFAGGVYRDSYRAAYGVGPSSPPGQVKVDPQIARLLDRYRLDRPATGPRSIASSVR